MIRQQSATQPDRRKVEWNRRRPPRLLLSTFILVLAVLPELAIAEPLASKRIGWASMDGTAKQIAKYWKTARKESDNLAVVTDRAHIYSGNAAVRLTTGETDRALLYQHWTRLGVTPGGRYRISFRARGKGTIAACHAAVDADSGRGVSAESLIADTSQVELKDSWQLISADIIIKNPNAALLSCGVELQGRNAVAFIDELNIYRIWDPNWRLEVTPAHPMIPVGGTTQVRLQLSYQDTPQGEQEILLNSALAKNSQSSLRTDHAGVALFRFTGKSTGLFSFSAAHLASGQLVTFHVDVLEQEVYRQFEAVAAKVTLKTPANLLFIGDSITDMQRGHNYVDKMGFWLRQRFGPKVTLKNAGIGGDDITRVWGRMNGNMSQYERERYPEWQPLLAPKPHHVFFFLGHNDSKLLGSTDWKETKVPIDLFSKTYSQAVERVQKETGAKVTILSATSSVYEKTKAKVDGRIKLGQKANLFGKPAVLESFNTAVRLVAEAADAEYLDVYEPTRTHSDKTGLFMYDGIHVNNVGNRLLALKLLHHLADE